MCLVRVLLISLNLSAGILPHHLAIHSKLNETALIYKRNYKPTKIDNQNIIFEIQTKVKILRVSTGVGNVWANFSEANFENSVH